MASVRQAGEMSLQDTENTQRSLCLLGLDSRWPLATKSLMVAAMTDAGFSETDVASGWPTAARYGEIAREGTYAKTLGEVFRSKYRRIPGAMARLLSAAWERHPGTVRGILSGFYSPEENDTVGFLEKKDFQSSASQINLSRLYSLSIASGIPMQEIWPESHVLAAGCASVLLALRFAGTNSHRNPLELKQEQYDRTPFPDHSAVRFLRSGVSAETMPVTDAHAGLVFRLLGYGTYVTTGLSSAHEHSPDIQCLDSRRIAESVTKLKEVYPLKAAMISEEWLRSVVPDTGLLVGKALLGIAPYSRERN